MKLLLYLFFTLAFLLSCNSDNSKPDIINDPKFQKFNDSIRENIQNTVNTNILNSDTAGLSIAPVRVISAKLVKKEYSNYRDVHLVYKNYSKKRITAIRFQWYGVNAFGDPADMGNPMVKGFGGGFMDNGLGIGETDDGEWSISSRDAKKIIAAYATEIAFADGTKWKNK